MINRIWQILRANFWHYKYRLLPKKIEQTYIDRVKIKKKLSFPSVLEEIVLADPGKTYFFTGDMDTFPTHEATIKRVRYEKIISYRKIDDETQSIR